MGVASRVGSQVPTHLSACYMQLMEPTQSVELDSGKLDNARSLRAAVQV